jgi:circadian clock protein KaiC
MAESTAATGIEGLDDILRGGLPRDRLYLVAGDPGTGKTTLGLQFLLEGARTGERGLYVALSETRDELEATARSHGWSLDALEVFELPAEDMLDPSHDTSVFHPSEIELNERASEILARVAAVNPTRVVFDSLSEMRLLAQSSLRYRRVVLMLKRHFVGRHCTVLLLDDRTGEGGDLHLESIAHGVIRLERLDRQYGKERRRIKVTKLRGVDFRDGYHDFRIRTGGVVVYPRLIAAEHEHYHPPALASTGIPQLDRLCGGGLDRGSSTLLAGPSGVGKSALSLQIAMAAVARGECVSLYSFEDTVGTARTRMAGLGIPIEDSIETGRLRMRHVNPAELAPGEFDALLREDAERFGASIVLIDSLNGYLAAMPDEHALTLQLHELLTYLGGRNVLTILTSTQRGLLGAPMSAQFDPSYLADTIILMRYFEASGHLRRAISVMKKRRGAHEATIREYRLSQGGLLLGEPLEEFQGVLTGVPSYFGASGSLMQK